MTRALAITPSPEPIPDGFIRLSDAAARMGENDGVLRRKCAEDWAALGLARKCNGEWYIARSVDPRLLEYETQEGRDLKAEAEAKGAGVPEDQLAKARKLAALFKGFVRFDSGRGQERDRIAAFLNKCRSDGTIGVGEKCHKPDTFRKLLKQYRTRGFAALVRKAYPDRGGRALGSKAREMFILIMRAGNGIPVTAAADQVRGHVIKNGWEGDPDWKLPAIRTVQEFWKEQVHPAAKTWIARGPHKMRAMHIPKIKRDARIDFEAGELLIGDQRTFDFMAREMGERGWVRFRPKVTAWRDGRSGMIVGHHVGRRADSDTILASFEHGVLDTGTMPREIIIDNGLDYKSVGGPARRNRRWDHFDDQRVKSFCERSGIIVHYAMPRAPWAKAIESDFRRLKLYDQFEVGFIGGSPEERPFDADAWTRRNVFELPTIEEVRERFKAHLEAFHDTPRRGESYEGLSPRQVFKTHYTTAPRRIDKKTLDMVCRKLVGPVKIGRDGVRYQRLRYGTFDEAVWKLQGRTVWMLIDPIDRDSIILAKEDGTPICDANVDRPLGYKSEELRDRIAHQRRCERSLKEYGPSRDYILKTPPQQIAERRRLAAKARQIPDEHLPSPRPIETVEIVRPDIAVAVEKLKRAAGAESLRKLSGVDAAAEAVNRPRQFTLEDLNRAAPYEPEPERTFKRWTFDDLNNLEAQKNASQRS